MTDGDEGIPLEAHTHYQIEHGGEDEDPADAKDMALTVTMEDIREVLAHTEILETGQGDLIVSPGQVWLSSGTLIESYEIELREDQFWTLVGVMLGEDAVREMKQELDDLLRWEAEGGACLA